MSVNSYSPAYNPICRSAYGASIGPSGEYQHKFYRFNICKLAIELAPIHKFWEAFGDELGIHLNSEMDAPSASRQHLFSVLDVWAQSNSGKIYQIPKALRAVGFTHRAETMENNLREDPNYYQINSYMLTDVMFDQASGQLKKDTLLKKMKEQPSDSAPLQRDKQPINIICKYCVIL